MTKNRRGIALVLIALALLLGFMVAGPGSTPVSAQAEPGLEVRTAVTSASYQALKETPMMVSVIKDGEVLKQRELRVNSSVFFALPPGIYDVRIEGDGMETLVKRGIRVVATEKTEIIGGPMKTGTGVKTIEYAVGGLSREEIAARIAKLEAALAELQKARAK